MLKSVCGDTAVTMKTVWFTSGSSDFVTVVNRLKTRADRDVLQQQNPKRTLKE